MGWLDLFLHGVEPPSAALLEGRPYHVWLIAGVVCNAGVIAQVDASIVQLALPTLARTLDASLNEVRWVAIAYLLAVVALLPVFGRLSELHGRKLLYPMGFVLFGLSSLLCGLASHLAELVAFRAVQGIGGAMLGADSLAILMKSIDAGSCSGVSVAPSVMAWSMAYDASRPGRGPGKGPVDDGGTRPARGPANGRPRPRATRRSISIGRASSRASHGGGPESGSCGKFNDSAGRSPTV